MEAENLILDDSSERQVIEELGELLPNVCVAILSQTFIIETIHLCDLSALVIASEDGDSILITHLKGDEKSHRLNTVVATIDVVTHEEVVRVGWLTSDLEKLSQVVELTMDITADGDGSAHLLHVRLVNQDFFSLVAEELDLAFWKGFA